MTTKTIYLSAPYGVISGRLSRRVICINGLLFIAGMLLVVLAICLGTLQLSPFDVWRALTGEASQGIVTVVTQWRAPRVVMALLLGAGLGVSGAIFQSIIRNPLGSPDIIGFSSGAYAGALVTIILLNGGYYEIASGALIGGILTAVAVYLLAWREGIVGFRLIIVGIAISAILAAFNTWLIITGSLESVMTAALWGTGSLNGVTWAKGQPAVMIIPVTIAMALLMGKRLQLLEMGDDSARALGVSAEASRLWLMLLGVILTAVVTAATGPIAFIALAAPQIARRLMQASSVPLFSSAMIGAILLLLADMTAQHAFTGIQLPVGAVTISIGGIYLIWLLVRESRR
ncbi:iron complex transport system permease protein|uniref:Iron complex transport system permease protein n=1 Tax=Brenneria salicis ATCC 15712 = DSM 30166 TaxID=714314 RepID=A0A366I4K8_9GAMM|nr:iron-enterobactin ABC transporter permease [Brenneria salicis]NMN92977.1 iron complex transport system permease protein [Brenneria salicis ATCC 15712 = DSM 30166]RBP61950.1 iron complex transport system permease protein [Brenneria salicis ATCC 15712 = DSM 30166]RLM31245.1 iron ABC transporter permease [Brenneria salicis ATCC 15712 = DSM 30166]